MNKRIIRKCITIMLTAVLTVTILPIHFTIGGMEYSNFRRVKAAPASVNVDVDIDTTWDSSSTDGNDAGLDYGDGYGIQYFVGCYDSAPYERAALRFDLSGRIPEGKGIIDVNLKFYVGLVEGNPVLKIIKANNSWDESDAGNLPLYNETADRIYYDSNSSNFVSGAVYTAHSEALTAYVIEQCKEDPAKQVSFVLLGNENNGTNDFGFRCSENTFDSAKPIPYLEITYTDQLPQVTNVSISDQGIATWMDQANEAGYHLQLLKDGLPATGGAVDVGPNVTTYNFLSLMRSNGPGEYKVRIRAAGDGTNYVDSEDSTSPNSQTVTKLTNVSGGLVWDGDKAKWTIPSGPSATAYKVQLYRDDIAVTDEGAEITVLAGAASEGADFGPILSGLGGGTYTFKVTAIGNDTLLFDSEESIASASNIKAIKLGQVANLHLTDSGAAEWDALTNAVSYSVGLYKGAAHIASDNTNGLSYDFLSAIRSNGPGSYTVKVTATGDGTYYSNGDPAESSAQNVSKLNNAANLNLTTAGLATWNAVVNASGYEVQLYRNGTAAGTPVSVTSGTSADFSANMTDGGTYKFTVIAKGDGKFILDSEGATSGEVRILYRLAQVAKPAINNQGEAAWTDVEDESSYQVTLYDESNNEISAAEEPAGTISHSFLADMRENGAGRYYVSVQAIGDGVDYASGLVSDASDYQTITQAATVAAGLTWTGDTAHWTGTADASGYGVQLHLNGSPVGAARSVLPAGVTAGMDFSDLIAANGGGVYTYKVTAKGDGYLVLDAEASAFSNENIEPVTLPRVTGVTISNAGTASWSDIANESGYTIKLYKDGSLLSDGAVAVAAGTVSYDYQSKMLEKGTGAYTVTVTATGDGTYYRDGAESEPSVARSVVKLAKVTGLSWNGNVANWTQADNAAGYEVQLYLEGTTEGALVSVSAANAASGVDFSSAFAAGSGGNYTFKVKAKGSNLYLDSDLSDASSQKRIASPLPQVTNVDFTANGTVRWTDAVNESGYSVQLYKDGQLFGAPVVAAADTTGYDFLATIRAAGAGAYTAVVTAIGDGINYSDGLPSMESPSRTVSRLAAASGLAWAGRVAHWSSVAGAVSYTVQLYKDHVPTGSPVTVLSSAAGSGADFTAAIASGGTGIYTFSVVANGDGVLILDSAVATDESATNVEAVTLPPVSDGLTWNGTVARWTEVAAAISYEVQLYQDGAALGAAINVPAGAAANGVDFGTAIQAAGYGVFTYTVTAKGNGTTLLDALPSALSSSIVNILNVSALTFDTNTSSANYRDIRVAVVTGGAISGSAITVRNGTETLTQGTDYTVENNEIVLFKAYLARQAVGTLNLTFVIQPDISQTVTFTIQRSTSGGNSGDGSGGGSGGPPGNSGGTTRTGSVSIDNGTTQETTAQVPITRTVNQNGTKKDTVRLTQNEISHTIDKAVESQTNTVTISVTDIPGDSADEIEVILPRSAVTMLKENMAALTIDTSKLSLALPDSTVSGLNNQDIDIRITEVTDKKEIENTETLLSQMSPGAQSLSTPVDVSTNYSRKTFITIPVASEDIPEDPTELDEFIASLAVLVRHSNGEVRLQKGTIRYDEDGRPVGITIPVDSFSTFTLVKASVEATETVISKKQMPDKSWTVTFNGTLDAATVTEDSVYVLDSKGNSVEVTLKSSGKSITVNAPAGYYKNGESYTLYMTSNIKYKSGKSIGKARKYRFSVGNVSLGGKKIKQYTNMASSKVFTVNLDNAINKKAFRADSVTVVNSECTKVKVKTEVYKNKYIKVSPAKSYASGKTYYIIIDGVEYSDGTKLEEPVWIKFTVKK